MSRYGLYSLEDGPVSRALTVEAPLLLAGQNVPDDDSLGVLLGVHQGTECYHVPAGKYPRLLALLINKSYKYPLLKETQRACAYLSHGEKSMRDTPW